MKSLVVKDRNSRKLIKNQSKKVFLKKFLAGQGVILGNTCVSSIKLNNRCITSWRDRSVSRFFKHSRIVLRENALNGDYSGVFKSSW